MWTIGNDWDQRQAARTTQEGGGTDQAAKYPAIMKAIQERTEMNCPKCGVGLSPTKHRFRLEFGCESFIWKADVQFYQSDKCKLTCAEKRIKELEEENAKLKSDLAAIANNIECGACAEQIFTGASMAGRKHTCGKPDAVVTITQLDCDSPDSAKL